MEISVPCTLVKCNISFDFIFLFRLHPIFTISFRVILNVVLKVRIDQVAFT